MIRWTGLAPWEFEFPFPGSLTSTFLQVAQKYSTEVEEIMSNRENKGKLIHKVYEPYIRALLGTAAQVVYVVDNLLVRIHVIIVMMRWTGLAP